jgi:tripartite-type tricarboxylate transporter receptor subunit TctC
MLTETPPSSAIAQSAYPDRPIRLVVAFAPGGFTDIIARLLGERLSDNLGQSVYIDNKGGATGKLGAKMVSSAEPDGYTLLVTTTAVAIGAAATPSDVNPVSQLSPIAAVASAPTLFVVKAPTATKGLKQFVVAHDERQPLTYSSAGTGTPEHLTAAYVLKGIPGGDAVHIPYRSGGEATNAVLGGHVDIAVTPSPTALALIQERKLKPLAVASHKRLAMFPDVPTLAESGLIDVENASWIAIFGPPNLPQPVVQTLSAAVSAALHESNFHKRLTEMGFDIQEMTQAEAIQYMRNETRKWGEILKATGVTLE